jgi:CBS-domain-containing membrane protein
MALKTKREDIIMKGTEYVGVVNPLSRMDACDLMEKDVPYFHPDTLGITLATAMLSRGYGSIPIVDHQKRLMGIVTEFDLLKALMEGRELENVKASDIMAQEAKFVKQHTHAREIIQIMDRLHLIHLPVVDEEGQLVGQIERSDILLTYLESKLSSLSEHFKEAIRPGSSQEG